MKGNCKNKGFALIAVLGLVALLGLIAVGLLTLSAMSMRQQKNLQAAEQAKTNAKLGLMEAINNLQVSLGPDQRVSAKADVFPGSTQPQLLGVWNSFKPANNDNEAIDYQNQKAGDFVQWLSSKNSANRVDPNHHTQEVSGSSSKIVGDGTVSDPVNHINVDLQTVAAAQAGAGSGSYAWHVMDESQKASLALYNTPPPANDVEKLAQLGTAAKPGFAVDPVYTPLDNLTDQQRSKLVTLESASLANFDPSANNALHYLTTESKSLLVDVVNGGYQKDLSLLFDGAALPAAYNNLHIYSEDNDPIADAPARFGGAEYIPSPDPKWSQLHSHFQLYNQVTKNGGKYRLDASTTERGDINSPFHDEQQILPVVSNIQFIYTLNAVGTSNHLYVAADTIVTLWNPYNVELEFDEMEFEVHRFPLDIQYIVNGVIKNRRYANIANTFSGGNLGGRDWGTQDNIPYRARITSDSNVLQPGEYKVFSNTTHQRTHGLGLYTTGVILEEGWNPREGGVSSRFIMAGDNGRGVGPRGAAHISLQKNDKVTLRVRARHVDRVVQNSETNNKEAAALVKVFQGDGGRQNPFTNKADMEAKFNKKRKHVGSIELDLPTLSDTLRSIDDPSKLLEYTFNGTSVAHGTPYLNRKPFLNASLRLKTEQDSALIDKDPNDQDAPSGDYNAPFWVHNGITNPYFSMGIEEDQIEIDPSAHQYELTWTPMTSWNDIPGVEVDSDGRGYGGTGVTSQTGVQYAPYRQIPLAPATSIAQFSHAPLNSGGLAPLTDQIVGNSFAPTIIPIDEKTADGNIGSHIDHSYMANNVLFDSYFLSTANTEQGPIYGGDTRNMDAVTKPFFHGYTSLTNPQLTLAIDPIPANEQPPKIESSHYDNFAQYLYNNGAFNVNSTSVEAWALFLASGTHDALPILNSFATNDTLTASTTLGESAVTNNFVYSRFSPMTGNALSSSAEFDDKERFASHRTLTADEILTLAQNVVAEVQARGPFQSVSEFVNRRLEDNPLTANSGALQTAIDITGINTDYAAPSAPKNYDELAGAGTGKTSDGAPSQITQADILTRLAPSLTVRGDTYKIRTYGDVKDAGGNVIAKSWCEATVQRDHEYMDNTQPSTTPVANLAPVNAQFGRKFKVISFRWLSASDI